LNSEAGIRKPEKERRDYLKVMPHLMLFPRPCLLLPRSHAGLDPASIKKSKGKGQKMDLRFRPADDLAPRTQN